MKKAKKRSTQSGRPLKGRFDAGIQRLAPKYSDWYYVIPCGEILSYEKKLSFSNI
jgi:hypothetical protein